MNAYTNTRTVFIAGLTAAALDITGAIVVYAYLLQVTTTQKLLQSVAAGALGKSSYAGGWQTAALGLLFHTLIALSFAGFYMLIYRYWTKLFSNTFLAGFIYGCFVWCVMNLLVLPVIVGKEFVFNAKYFFWGIGLIIFCVGVPIGLITGKSFKS